MVRLDTKKILSFLLVLLIIILPFFLVRQIQPEWIGRMIAEGYYNIAMILVFLLLAINPNYEKKSKINPRIKDRIKNPERYIRNWGIGIRLFGLLFLIFWAYSGLTPYAKDVGYLVNKNELIIGRGLLTKGGGGTIPFSEYFFQSLAFDGEKNADNYFSYHFASPLKVNKYYEFKYIPETRLILEIREVSDKKMFENEKR